MKLGPTSTVYLFAQNVLIASIYKCERLAGGEEAYVAANNGSKCVEKINNLFIFSPVDDQTLQLVYISIFWSNPMTSFYGSSLYSQLVQTKFCKLVL